MAQNLPKNPYANIIIDMPRIYLKPNSAEYADDEKPSALNVVCDMPGCEHEAEFRAPKDRSLDGHYIFCQQHITEYNKAWDYFSGMAQHDIEDHIIRSNLWDRPTWKFKSGKENAEEYLRTKTWQFYHYTDKNPDEEQKSYNFTPHYAKDTPEHEAMAIMGLQPPLDLPSIKAKYKELVKRYHPDINHGDKKAEEMLKSINMSYTILKLAYDKFEVIQKDKD